MRIKEAFEKRKTNGQKALITYIVSGDFGYETTKKNIMSMVNAGADIIEIGIPFSDPIAEGIVIRKPASIPWKEGLHWPEFLKWSRNSEMKLILRL